MDGMKAFFPPQETTLPFNEDGVSVFSITQATATIFPDLYIGQTFLCLILAGTKRVICPVNGEMIGNVGDLLVFPPGSIVTLENRPVLRESYRAEGLYFHDDLVEAVYADQGHSRASSGIQIVRALPHNPPDIVALLKTTLADRTLSPLIRRHRLLEPLLWLRQHGIRLPVHDDEQPLGRLRRLIETDLSHPWRVADAAETFAMSEATFRRWLAKSGQGFSRILQNTRLERGLALLQTTNISVSQIALECGFKTPSHFSDAFRRRFGIKPSAIRSLGD